MGETAAFCAVNMPCRMPERNVMSRMLERRNKSSAFISFPSVSVVHTYAGSTRYWRF